MVSEAALWRQGADKNPCDRLHEGTCVVCELDSRLHYVHVHRYVGCYVRHYRSRFRPSSMVQVLSRSVLRPRTTSVMFRHFHNLSRQHDQIRWYLPICESAIITGFTSSVEERKSITIERWHVKQVYYANSRVTKPINGLSKRPSHEAGNRCHRYFNRKPKDRQPQKDIHHKRFKQTCWTRHSVFEVVLKIISLMGEGIQ